MKKNSFPIFLFCMLAGYGVRAQSVAINNDNSTPDASAMLDVKNASKGILIPRVASTGAVASPATGLLVYVTGSGFYYNAGTPASPLWLNITAAGNAFNGANQLVQLNGSGQLPAVSGVNLTNLNAGNLVNGTVATARLGSGTANNTTYLRGDGTWASVDGGNLTNLNASNLASGTVATARLGSGTANSSSYLRGDGTWAPVGDSYPLFSSTIAANNANGNGTYYLTTGGISATEKDFARLLNGSCATVKLTAVAEGTLTSGYTLSLRKGTFSGGTLTFSDIAGSTITVSGATLQSVTVPNVNLTSGNLLGVKFVGTATVTSQAKTIYVSCSCLN